VAGGNVREGPSQEWVIRLIVPTTQAYLSWKGSRFLLERRAERIGSGSNRRPILRKVYVVLSNGTSPTRIVSSSPRPWQGDWPPDGANRGGALEPRSPRRQAPAPVPGSGRPATRDGNNARAEKRVMTMATILTHVHPASAWGGDRRASKGASRSIAMSAGSCPYSGK